MKNTPKAAGKSLTVRASLAQAVVPALAFLIARYGANIAPAEAAMLAAALYAILQAVANVGLRRATGGGLAALLLSCALMLGGCSASISKAYVRADEKTYTYLADDYVRRVEEDPKMSTSSKRIARKVVESWRRRIDEAKR